MAQINFDKNIKNKLEKRSIQPSENAWNTLANKLNKEENKVNNKGFWWLGIAASVVGILFIANFYFNNTTDNIAPIVVETQDDIIEESQNKIPSEYIMADDTVIIEKTVTSTETSKNQDDNSKMEIVHPQRVNPLVSMPSEAISNNTIVQSENETPPESQTINKMKSENITFEEQKVQEIVAQIQGLEDNNSTIAEAEIDKLLEQAEKQIRLKKLYNETKKTVDANALLQGVETDLEQSFRDKVFKALKTSYKSVKTAVVQRNE